MTKIERAEFVVDLLEEQLSQLARDLCGEGEDVSDEYNQIEDQLEHAQMHFACMSDVIRVVDVLREEGAFPANQDQQEALTRVAAVRTAERLGDEALGSLGWRFREGRGWDAPARPHLFWEGWDGVFTSEDLDDCDDQESVHPLP